jgi:flagellar FliL protein
MSAAAATANVAATDAPAPAAKKGRKLLIALFALVVLALLAGAGALYILKKNTAEYDGEDGLDGAETSQSAPARSSTPPVFLPLDNMVVNLADAGGSRFVQIGISLQIQDSKTGEEMKAYMPSIRSAVLLLISQRTSEEMLQLQGKEKLAKDIVTEISRIMGYRTPDNSASGDRKRAASQPSNPVQAVLFSSFIVQ